MPYDTFPVDADVAAYFLAQWPTLNSGQLTTLVTDTAEEAQAEFLKRTCREVFLAEDEPSTVYYDPPGWGTSKSRGYPVKGGGKLLELRDGYQSISTVYVGVDNQASASGEALTYGVNYWYRPVESPQDGKPIELIEFSYPIWGWPQSVQIVGVRGWSSQVPSDVFRSIVKRAASLAAPAVIQNMDDGIAEVSQGSAKLKFDAPDMFKSSDQWKTEAYKTWARYKLLHLGA